MADTGRSDTETRTRRQRLRFLRVPVSAYVPCFLFRRALHHNQNSRPAPRHDTSYRNGWHAGLRERGRDPVGIVRARRRSEVRLRSAGRRADPGSVSSTSGATRTPLPEVFAIGAPAARDIAAHQLPRAVEQRDARGVDFDRATARHRHLGRVSDQAEPGNVGTRMHNAGSRPLENLGGGAIQRHHRSGRRVDRRLRGTAELQRGGDDASSDRLWSAGACRLAARRRWPAHATDRFHR